jgi:hypothetical protein
MIAYCYYQMEQEQVNPLHNLHVDHHRAFGGKLVSNEIKKGSGVPHVQDALLHLESTEQLKCSILPNVIMCESGKPDMRCAEDRYKREFSFEHFKCLSELKE